MLNELKNAVVLVLRLSIKSITGFIIIPLGIIINQVKPGWEVASLPVKAFTGVILIPITVFLYFAIPWWEDYKIVK